MGVYLKELKFVYINVWHDIDKLQIISGLYKTNIPCGYNYAHG